MKKTISCLIAAALMLSVFVSAQLSEPDAQGNAVCSGQYDLTTKYNVEKLNAVMRAISDPAMISEEDTTLAVCTGKGSVRLDYRTADGTFIEFAEIYGTVTATPAAGKIEIADGALNSLETPESRRRVGVMGKAITLQFVKDAQQNVNPMFRVSNDGAYLIESVFFGCLKKDENGRQLSCAMSGQLYKEGDAEHYLTITGSGFVGESVFDGTYFQYDMADEYLRKQPNNIEELKEKAGLVPEDPFVAMPLTDLKEIKVTLPDPGRENILNLQAKAQGETSSVDSVRIKSGKEITISNFITNYRPMEEYGNAGAVVVKGDDNLKATADGKRIQEGTPFTLALAREAEENAKASLFLPGGRLAESDEGIYVFPEIEEDAYNMITSYYPVTAYDSLLLKPSSQEIKIFSVGSMLDVYLLEGYNSVTITPLLESGLMLGSVKVTNPRNNMWIMYANNELTWTQGKSIKDLGFNFNVNLNPALGEAEMLSCTTDGICWLGNTMVVSPSGALTQEKLTAAMAPARERREAGEGQKAAAEGCGSIEDCPEGRYCDFSMDEPECRRLGRTACSEEEPCESAGLYCDNGRCRDVRRVPCEADEECPGNYICNAELKRCTVRTGQVSFGVEFGKSAEEEEGQCGKCGEGAFNLCSREECAGLGQCYFQKKAIGGLCTAVIATTPRQLTGEEFEEVMGTKSAGRCDSIEDCPEGRYCDFSMDEPECRRLGRMACSEEEPCEAAGLYCDDGRCRDVRRVPCEADEECPGNYICNAELKRCTVRTGQVSFGVEFGKSAKGAVGWEVAGTFFGTLKERVFGIFNIEQETATATGVKQ